MKISMHMICNAHLHPVWQWEREERMAVDFCEEYDGFVFSKTHQAEA